MTRRSVLLLLGFSAIVFGHHALAQAARSDHGLTVIVRHMERNRFGFLHTVEIVNTSGRDLVLPQAPDWRPNAEFDPRVQSLNVEQWSDGKTNLLSSGRSVSSSLPPKVGYFSVGPCRDLPFDGHWISLNSGDQITDQIQAFELDQHDYIPSSCTWRHARLLRPLRISVEAFRTADIKQHDSVMGSVVFTFPQRCHQLGCE